MREIKKINETLESQDVHVKFAELVFARFKEQTKGGKHKGSYAFYNSHVRIWVRMFKDTKTIYVDEIEAIVEGIGTGGYLMSSICAVSVIMGYNLKLDAIPMTKIDSLDDPDEQLRAIKETPRLRKFYYRRGFVSATKYDISLESSSEMTFNVTSENLRFVIEDQTVRLMEDNVELQDIIDDEILDAIELDYDNIDMKRYRAKKMQMLRFCNKMYKAETKANEPILSFAKIHSAKIREVWEQELKLCA